MPEDAPAPCLPLAVHSSESFAMTSTQPPPANSSPLPPGAPPLLSSVSLSPPPLASSKTKTPKSSSFSLPDASSSQRHAKPTTIRLGSQQLPPSPAPLTPGSGTEGRWSGNTTTCRCTPRGRRACTAVAAAPLLPPPVRRGRRRSPPPRSPPAAGRPPTGAPPRWRPRRARSAGARRRWRGGGGGVVRRLDWRRSSGWRGGKGRR
ncbi:hypothetical protein Cni_G09769 [Canna indica]|uniref:Uncharacterized protein n=1 Tax=Canna indica TaxID=4628 RepID=A0AAQ3Q6S6_9LILI|nr:hypothetical protein Cni_G09769 [Canna indica]